MIYGILTPKIGFLNVPYKYQGKPEAVVIKLRKLSPANRKRDDKAIVVYHTEGKR